MKKTTLTALAPAAALIAFAMLPAMAQATRAQANGGTLAVGSAVQMSSTNLKTQMSAGTITCSNSDHAGTVGGENPTETLEGPIDSESFIGCTGPSGSTIDIKTNATTTNPWKLQVQQPDAKGKFVAHFDPASGSSMQETWQLQTFLGDLGTCDFSASSLQFEGEEGSDVLTLTGSNQFTLQSGPSSVCGNGTATQEGSYQVTSGGNPVTIDMS